MKKIIYVLTFLLVLNVMVVKAADLSTTCTNEELERIKELAKKVEINYEYELKEINQNGETVKYPVFSLVATNLNNDLKVVISSKNKEFEKKSDSTTSKLSGFAEGDRVVVTIKAFVPNKCSGKTVLSKTIKIPYYNRFFENEKCKNYPEFKYCSEFTDTIINNNKFYDEFELYLANLQKTNNVEISEKESNTLLILSFIIIIIIILGVAIYKFIVIKRKKDEL